MSAAIDRQGLLQLLHQAQVGRVPVRYTVRETTDRRLLHVASLIGQPAMALASSTSGSSPQPLPSGVDEIERRCWVAGRRRFRVDTDSSRTVVDGTDTFTWTAQPGGPGLIRMVLQPAMLPAAELLEGRSLLAVGDPELVEGTTHLDRAAYSVVVRLSPRNDPARLARVRQPVGADERRVIVDAEHGLILHEEACFSGEVVSRFEVTEIEFDPTFDDDTLALAGPDGAEPSYDETPATEPMMANQSLERLGFHCLVPANKIFRMRWPSATLHHHRDGRVVAEVTLLDGAEQTTVTIRQSRDAPPGLPAEAVAAIQDGGYWREPETSDGGEPDVVHVGYDSVWVRVAVDRSGSLRRRMNRMRTVGPEAPIDLDALAIAHDLVPYPTGPPRLVRVDPEGLPV